MRTNKRGVSEIVSYVLLITIALALSTLVFAFLKVYVPKDKPECTKEINMIIQDLNCVNSAGKNELTLVLQNRGLFKIDKAFIRIGEPSRKFREDLPATNPINLRNASGSEGLNPQESTLPLHFDLPSKYSSPGQYALEVQPSYFTIEKDIESLAICAPITQLITCS